MGDPGSKGLEHRIGGLEKEDVTGNVSYDPDNHQHMVKQDKQKLIRSLIIFRYRK
jgi:2-oxoglutarate ferredoxin oxidoreductase subunit alpha